MGVNHTSNLIGLGLVVSLAFRKRDLFLLFWFCWSGDFYLGLLIFVVCPVMVWDHLPVGGKRF